MLVSIIRGAQELFFQSPRLKDNRLACLKRMFQGRSFDLNIQVVFKIQSNIHYRLINSLDLKIIHEDYISLTLLGNLFFMFLEPYNKCDKEYCRQQGNYFALRHQFELLIQHFHQRDIKECPSRNAHEERHDKHPLVDKNCPCQQSKNIDQSLDNYHNIHYALFEAFFTIH